MLKLAFTFEYYIWLLLQDWPFRWNHLIEPHVCSLFLGTSFPENSTCNLLTILRFCTCPNLHLIALTTVLDLSRNWLSFFWPWRYLVLQRTAWPEVVHNRLYLIHISVVKTRKWHLVEAMLLWKHKRWLTIQTRFCGKKLQDSLKRHSYVLRLSLGSSGWYFRQLVCTFNNFPIVWPRLLNASLIDGED